MIIRTAGVGLGNAPIFHPPNAPGTPNKEKRHQPDDREDRGHDVDQPRSVEIGDQELRDGKASAGDEKRRPDLGHPPEAGEGPNQPERDDDREERQDAPGLRAESKKRQPRHPLEGDHRRAQGPEGHGGGVGDERQPGGGERAEPEADEDRGRDGHGSPEPGRALEEGAEAKGDEEELQPAVARYARQAFLENLKVPLFARQVEEENDIQDDPADREEPVGGPENGHGAGLGRRHAEDRDRDQERRDEAEERRPMGFEAEESERSQKNDDRDGRDEGREEHTAQGIVNLLPAHLGPRLYHRPPGRSNSLPLFARPPFSSAGGALGPCSWQARAVPVF